MRTILFYSQIAPQIAQKFRRCQCGLICNSLISSVKFGKSGDEIATTFPKEGESVQLPQPSIDAQWLQLYVSALCGRNLDTRSGVFYPMRGQKIGKMIWEHMTRWELRPKE